MGKQEMAGESMMEPRAGAWRKNNLEEGRIDLDTRFLPDNCKNNEKGVTLRLQILPTRRDLEISIINMFGHTVAL